MNMTRRTAAVRVLAVLVLAAWGLCGRVVADEAHVAEIVAAVQEGGRLTTRILYPIPHGEGKVEAVRELVQARPRGVAVAGFGNSYSTDGAFLRYIATQRLPGGARPVSMMINGGAEPARYRGLFRCVAQDEVVGPAADAVRAGGRE